MNNQMKSITTSCYEASIALLKSNSTRFGILACSPQVRAEQRNYLSIFGRDAGISSLGMILSGDAQLISSARLSLETLAQFQAANGQIPNYVKPEKPYADFWYINCIDSTLWWLIAVDHFDKYSGAKIKLRQKLAKQVKNALKWLDCQEHPLHHLLVQGEAADWADIMPRSGMSLYANALWCLVKSAYNSASLTETRQGLNYFLYPWQKIPSKYIKNNPRAKRLIETAAQKIPKQANYLSFANYQFYGEEVDIYGNLLALFAGVPNKKIVGTILDFLISKKISAPKESNTVLKPIKSSSKQWREYMMSHNQNIPGQYHNGGHWPYIDGFFAAILYKAGRKQAAFDCLEALAELNLKTGFSEWIKPKTGQPQGMTGQSWNAAMYIYAAKTLGVK
jgi:GH15 family glucan-1,4-alpha-glucosidase